MTNYATWQKRKDLDKEARIAIRSKDTQVCTKCNSRKIDLEFIDKSFWGVSGVSYYMKCKSCRAEARQEK